MNIHSNRLKGCTVMPKRNVNPNISTSREFRTQHKNNLNYGSSVVNECTSNYRVATVLATEIR